MKKWVLAAFLALALALCLFPVSAMATDSDFTIEDGVLMKYNGPGGDVVIPNTVTEIAGHAFEECKNLTSVVIPSTVTRFGWAAFYDCPNLTTAIYPYGCFCNVTSDSLEVRYTAFQECPNMNAFLTKNEFSTDDTVLVQYVGKKDNGCVTIPEGFTGIEGFSRSLNDGFGYGGTFLDDEELTKVILPNSLIYIGEGAFSGCPNLREITIPSGVTEIQRDAFTGSGLTHVTIPENVTTIGSGAFSRCKSLTDVTLPSGITIGSGAFSYSGLTSLTVPAGVASIGDGAFGYCNDLSTVTFSATTSQVGSGVFRDCKNLEHVTFTSGVSRIADQMFSGCVSLKSLDLASSLQSIGKRAFSGCTGLASVTLPAGVTSIGDSAFGGCTNLTSVAIPDSVTSIGSSAFSNCGKLTRVILGAKIGAEEKKAAFGGTPWYKNLDEVIFKSENGVLVEYNGPGGDVIFPSSIAAIGESTFMIWSAPDKPITSIVIPSSVTEIRDRAFYNRGDIKSVTLMPGLKTIGTQAFYRCSLTEVVIPEGVTSIGGAAFVVDNAALKRVYIPASVTSIGRGAFGWEFIDDIYYGGSEADWYAIEWDTYNGKPGNLQYGEGNSNIHYNSPAPKAPVVTVGGFGDVKADSWYADAVRWAVRNDITNGTSATSFSPGNTCTQGHILTFLWRSNGEPEPAGTVAGTQFYAKAAQWAKEQGLTDDFNADAPCTRAMVVTYLWKLAGSPDVGAPDFTDVSADADYAQAVAWAVKQGITNGTSDTTFSPEQTCTRGHIVTFLYRAYA